MASLGRVAAEEVTPCGSGDVVDQVEEGLDDQE